ncbi:uncharacterized protein IL334_002283 [Kwoniella shivajii]|uniref:Transcription factor domain-containing protein n=1 Tax=Kwoniella shivajii TaxID=564305 RepID=A0ABZ1CUK8_9TREE|nr:hypothetical protein IL334_002283 [Kwoniella shivajii]
MVSKENENITLDGQPRPPAKRKSRSTRGLLNKVNALEEQMEQVKNNLENVVSLLLRIAPATLSSGSPLAAHSILSTNGGKKDNGQAMTQSDCGHTSNQPQSAPSLEQWVEQIASGSSLSNKPDSQRHDVTFQLEAHEVENDEEDSLTEEEKDQPEGETEGMSIMRDILRREERKRLRADGHLPSVSVSPKLGFKPSDHNQFASSDSPRFDHDIPNNSFGMKKRKRVEYDPNPEQRRSSVAPLDPIELGLCSEIYGRELFALFFHGAHAFIPVFDPSKDTLESLRDRSSFSITAILFVGQKIKDAGREVSNLQKSLKDHAEYIGKTTLFSPIAHIEALQAMIVLASWGDTGWRPGSHAISMATDMELYKCLPKLAEKGANTSVQSDPRRLEEEASWTQGARLWLIVCKLAIEMSLNYGRPLLLDENLIFPHMFSLLDHPGGLQTDSRIIASCELLQLRLPAYKATLARDNETLDRALQIVNDGAGAWEQKWKTYYMQKGVSSEDILVTDLTTQRCFLSVLANSWLLRYIGGPHHVSMLPPHRRRWILSSLDNARFITERILSTEKEKLIHANHFSHVALASVCRIYIRLASLFPEAVDLRRVAKELTQLADVLAQFPGFYFAQQLRYVINKARQRKILPPETRPSSPRRAANSTTNYQETGNIDSDHPTHTHGLSSELRSIQHASELATNESPLEFDPLLVEQLLNETFLNRPPDAAIGMSGQHPGEVNWAQVFENPSVSWSQNEPFAPLDPQSSFLSWLDFPALDPDQYGHRPTQF